MNIAQRVKALRQELAGTQMWLEVWVSDAEHYRIAAANWQNQYYETTRGWDVAGSACPLPEVCGEDLSPSE